MSIGASLFQSRETTHLSRNRWWKTGLLWQCSMQKAVNWQGWISTAYLKSGVSWKKSYVKFDHKDIIHFEFLSCSQTLNADLDSQQL